ncbi:MAG: endoribonuclease MazF [Candidatus Fermentibacteria bacterium]|nr:endoribonuclease MazF [Candidatus Fermentibacteria bacterium]
MVTKTIPPGRGDLVWISLDPQAGHEQAGRRPALIISPRKYNHRVGLALMCPVTSRIKGYPFEVQLPEGCLIEGVVLSDQVKSLDWRARQVELIENTPDSFVSNVLGKLKTLL